jgi:hypothetical protein
MSTGLDGLCRWGIVYRDKNKLGVCLQISRGSMMLNADATYPVQ